MTAFSFLHATLKNFNSWYSRASPEDCYVSNSYLLTHSKVKKDQWVFIASSLEFWWDLGGPSFTLLLKSHCTPLELWNPKDGKHGRNMTLMLLTSTQPPRLTKCNLLVRSSPDFWVYREPAQEVAAHRPLHCWGTWESRYGVRSALQPLAAGKQQPFPTSHFQEQKRLEKWSKNKEPQEAMTLLSRAHFTSLCLAPFWYSTILLKQQILTNSVGAMWWGKGCFHWEEAKLILPHGDIITSASIRWKHFLHNLPKTNGEMTTGEGEFTGHHSNPGWLPTKKPMFGIPPSLQRADYMHSRTSGNTQKSVLHAGLNL